MQPNNPDNRQLATQASRPSSSGIPMQPPQPPQPQPIRTPTGELMQLSRAIASSHLFNNFDTAEVCFVAMAMTEATGLPGILAFNRYHVITMGGSKRLQMHADAMAADFQRFGGKILWKRCDREAAEADFIHPVHAPTPGVPGLVTLAEMIESKEALDWDKDFNNGPGKPKGQWVLKFNYQKIPHIMLQWALVRRYVHMIMPGIVVGTVGFEDDSGGEGSEAIEENDNPGRDNPGRIDGGMLGIPSETRQPAITGSPPVLAPGLPEGAMMLPPAVDPSWDAKVQEAERIAAAGTVKPTGPEGQPVATVNYQDQAQIGNAGETGEVIRAEQAQRLRELVQDILKWTPDEWRAMIMDEPYRVAKMADLTAWQAQEIIGKLEREARTVVGEDVIDLEVIDPEFEVKDDIHRPQAVVAPPVLTNHAADRIDFERDDVTREQIDEAFRLGSRHESNDAVVIKHQGLVVIVDKETQSRVITARRMYPHPVPGIDAKPGIPEQESVPSQPEQREQLQPPLDGDPRIPLINEALSGVGRLNWSMDDLSGYLAKVGKSDIAELTQIELSMMLEDINYLEETGQAFTPNQENEQVPETVRPAPKSTRKGKKQEKPSETDRIG